MSGRSLGKPAARVGAIAAGCSIVFLLVGRASADGDRAFDAHTKRPSHEAETVALLVTPEGATDEAGYPGTEADQVLGHIRRKEFAQALEAARALSRAHPKNPAGFNLQGATYLGMNDLASARKAFEKALQIRPGYVPALMNLAEIDIKQKDLAGARNRYRSVLSQNPKSVPAMLAMAKVEFLDDRSEEGLRWLERVKTEHPDALPARLLLATYLLRSKDFGKALAELNDAQRMRPDDPEVLQLLGQAQLANNQRSRALATYQKLVSLRPKSPLAYYRLASAQISLQRFPDAIKSLNEALRLKPEYIEAISALGALEIQAGRYAEALERARRLQQLAPKNPAGHVLEGDVLSGRKRFGDAVSAYTKAQKLVPEGSTAIRIHVARTRAGNKEQADADLLLWLKAHPDDATVRSYLAGEYMRAGRDKLAIEQYELLLHKQPRDAVALNNLANLYHRAGDERALATAEKAFAIMPDAAATADTYGWLLVQQGQTGRGLPLLQKALAREPKNPEVRYHVAVALAKSGSAAEAKRQLQELLRSDATFPQREAAQALLDTL